MSSSFPTSIDAYSTKTNADTVEASHINNPQDAIVALETKVGVDNSAVATSLDYRLGNTTAGHDHDGSDSKKVIATNLNPTGLTASQLLRINSGGTAVESSGYTIASLMSALWPIGSVYTNITGVNPGTELGFGTWSQIAGGKVLIGQSSGDTDFDTAEETGGSKTATLGISNLPSHNHTGSTAADESSHTHTGPSHTHTGTTGNNSVSHYHNTISGNPSGHAESTSFGGANVYLYGYRDNNDQNDYYMYQSATSDAPNCARSGSQSANHTHTITTAAGGTGDTGAGSAHGHALTIASQGSGTAFSIINPYFVVYFFKRTA